MIEIITWMKIIKIKTVVRILKSMNIMKSMTARHVKAQMSHLSHACV